MNTKNENKKSNFLMNSNENKKAIFPINPERKIL